LTRTPCFHYPHIVDAHPSAPRHTTSPEQTLAEGRRLGSRLAAEFPGGAVVLLVGPLGAGKTVLARGIAAGLGIDDRLVSPTYTIIAEYHGGGKLLHHVDLYRVEGRDQMENLGLEDIMAGGGYVLVEWGEKMEQVLDVPRTPRLRVTLSLAPDGGRDILVENAAGYRGREDGAA
jgi:tRNA threonylcarbamoyladenosine biosynthesis protein TsaE